MSTALAQYLRTHRRRAGLTQRELAALLGLETVENVSRYERLVRHPSLETSLACQHIFNVSAQELFPGLTREVEQEVRHRAQQMLNQLDLSDDPQRDLQKRAILTTLASDKHN